MGIARCKGCEKTGEQMEARVQVNWESKTDERTRGRETSVGKIFGGIHWRAGEEEDIEQVEDEHIRGIHRKAWCKGR